MRFFGDPVGKRSSSERQLNWFSKEFFVIVEPDILARCLVVGLFPTRTVLKQHASQNKSATAAVFKIEVYPIPGQFLCFTRLNGFVPAKILNRARIIKIPVQPLPMFGSVRNSRVENKSNNLPTTHISNSSTHAVGGEVSELDGASRCRRGGAALCAREGGLNTKNRITSLEAMVN
jgi:hypothetical protein